MRKAIQTKYLGPTNTKGSRIKACAEGVKIGSFSRNSALSTEANHCEAARILAARFGWSGLWVGGGTPDGNGFVYVGLGRGPVEVLDFTDGEQLRTQALEEVYGKQGEDWFLIP